LSLNDPRLPIPGRLLSSVEVNGKSWKKFKGEWVQLPGNIGSATVTASFD